MKHAAVKVATLIGVFAISAMGMVTVGATTASAATHLRFHPHTTLSTPAIVNTTWAFVYSDDLDTFTACENFSFHGKTLSGSFTGSEGDSGKWTESATKGISLKIANNPGGDLSGAYGSNGTFKASEGTFVDYGEFVGTSTWPLFLPLVPFAPERLIPGTSC